MRFWRQIFVSLIATLVFTAAVSQADAQTPPVTPPPPTQDGSRDDAPRQGSGNDEDAPEIQIITTELREGKNVVMARIIDSNPLATDQVRFVRDGRIKSVEMVRDQGDVYKALIDVKPPSSVLVFEATDINGNKGTAAKWFNVSPVQKNILEQFIEWLANIFSFS